MVDEEVSFMLSLWPYALEWRYMFGNFVLRKLSNKSARGLQLQRRIWGWSIRDDYCFRPSAHFLNPSSHQVIHLYATSFKGSKFYKGTRRVEEVNHFDLITPSKRQQLLFDGPSKHYDLPVLQPEFAHRKHLEDTYKEWSQVIYTARLEYSAY
jgi:hypothetical protein